MELLIPIVLGLYLYFSAKKENDIPVWSGGEIRHAEDAFTSRYKRIMERGGIQ